MNLKEGKNISEELITNLQERGVHICCVKNGIIQEATGQHTIEEIKENGGEEITSISPENLGEFLEVFLSIKKEKKQQGGHISLHTQNTKITIYGGEITKKIIEENLKLQSLKLLPEAVISMIEQVRSAVVTK